MIFIAHYYLLQIADPGYAAGFGALKQLKCNVPTQYASIYYHQPSGTYKDSLEKAGMYCQQDADCNKMNNGTSKLVCQRCPHGRYVDAHAQTKCNDCSPGTYLNYGMAGVNTCQTCAKGTVSKVAASKCEACATGKYHNRDGFACESCPGGRFQNAAGTHYTSGGIIHVNDSFGTNKQIHRARNAAFADQICIPHLQR